MPQYSSDIDAAEAELQQELREMFTVDTQQHLETYFTLIEQLTAQSWAADIQHLYRAIHTIKGGAVTVAADGMLHAAIGLEDLLSDLRYLEQSPPLADLQLIEILREAGELLSSSIEIIETGELAIAQVQPTVQRLEQLRALVKQLYLPDWSELKQVHQEFAEQGFDLVTLELEMALAKIPDRGIVPANVIDTAQATIAQLTQLGRDLELAPGWSLLIQGCEKLIDQPSSPVWRQVWPQYFQVLKTCVKDSGEISDTEIDRLETLTAAAITTDAEVAVGPIPLNIPSNGDLPDLLDDFFGDEAEPIVNEDENTFAAWVIESDVEQNGTTPGSIDWSSDLSSGLDNLFDREDANFAHEIGQLDSSVSSVTDEIATSIEDISDTLDNFFFDEDEESILITDNSAKIDSLADSFLTTSIEDISGTLDNFFFDEDEELSLITDNSAKLDSPTDTNVAEIATASIEDISSVLDDFFFDEDEDKSSSLIGDSAAQVNPLIEIITVSETSISYDEPKLTLSSAIDRELDLLENFSLDLDRSFELSELEESELITLIESGFADRIDTESISSTPIPTIDLPQIPTAERPVETSKRGIQIPVPLERLDKSAQQVVETLLTARAVMNISSQLQSQLNQLTNLTQESSQFVAKLRQLQDDYALLRNLSDEQDSGNNVTLERYRQGYTTINRLLENILRMSELGQEIETATYQSATRLDALDRSIVRLKDGIETSRLVPFRNMALRARAILRDLTNRYGKPVELVVENEQIELDAGIVQQLEPALLHLLRNAYDHGLEPIEQRLTSGKLAQGMIHLSLNRRGNLYRLTVEDDGGGIDAERIHQIATSKGFNYQQTGTNAELLAVLCQPGFSSTSSVSEVSGRGVGMDVVTAQIATLGGTLTLETLLGHGTKFTIEIPAPQLLVPCILLQVSDRIVALPTDEILETALMSSMMTEALDEDAGLCSWTLTTSRGQVLGFDLANYWQPTQRSLPDTAICIRTRQADGTAEIWSIADDLLGQSELLINPLPSPLIAPVGLLGVSLQPDGRLISILDPIALTSKIATAPVDSTNYSLSTLAIEQSKPSAPTILIVDDAALMRRRFEASLNTHGFITHTCNDGVEALNWLQSNLTPDLMITDVEMPNMDGFTLIDRCRQAKIDLPILVVSSRLSEEWGKEARRLGANDYLNKGFSTAELLQKVDRLLGVGVRG
jgi:chemotaxis protein histidine kinase CheA